MHEPGDVLLFALSAWKQTGWSAFKKAFEEIYLIRLSTEEIHDADPIRFERSRALRTLLSLGHCDVDFSGTPSITIASPVLASLPYRGLPRAVLCGSRSPTTVETLQRLYRQSPQSLRILLETQRKRSPYAPCRVEIEAESHAMLERVAETLNIGWVETPPSWLFAEASGSVAEYVAQLEWSSQAEVNWERQDFDPLRFAFVPAPRTANGMQVGMRLSRYLNPVNRQWEHRLIIESRSASVTPEWGRYAVLDANRKSALLYDKKSGSVGVARGTPLPIFVARALALCSGYAPKFLTARFVQSSIPEQYGFDVYDGVPPDVIDVLAMKLGQQVPLDPLSIREETP
jgi:hypothetical protein